MIRTLGPLEIAQDGSLRSFYFWTALSKVSLLTPFFALYVAHRVGATTSEVALLFATYSAVRFLTEVPLGIVADQIGERATLQFSQAAALAAAALFAFGPFPALVVRQALFAVSESAMSGAQESLLYRLCAASTGDDRIAYQEAQPAFVAAAWWGIVAGGVFGAFVVWWSLDALGPATVAVAVLKLSSSLFLPSVPRETSGAPPIQSPSAAVKYIAEVQFWFFIGGLILFLLSTTYFMIQPLLNELGLADARNGLMYSGVTIFAAYAAHATNRLNGWFASPAKAVLAALCLLGMAVALLYQANSLIVVTMAMAILRFSWGWLGAGLTTTLNSALPLGSPRATILSLQSLLTSILGAAALGGVAALHLTATMSLLVLLGLVGMIASAVLIYLIRN